MTAISPITIRPMLAEDLPAIIKIEACCYTEIAPESVECIGAKLLTSPSTCFVGCCGNQVIAFLLSLPIQFESPPLLHQTLCAIPESADTLYLHDLAVSPDQRGCGIGRLLIEAFMNKMKELELKRASLIAVQNSGDYWIGHGFRPVTLTSPLKDKLMSYGQDACYMELSPSSESFRTGRDLNVARI
jgi:ribosomal protein S18 acetylase RimI-like enzyme